nr:GYD domain-containing protein [Rhodothermus bifroesti]
MTMATYLIFTRLGPDAFRDPNEFRQLAERVSSEIQKRCPGVTWKESYVTLGRFDIVDIVEAADQKEVERAAMLIRALARATTETMPATPWKTFLAHLS